MQIRIFRNPYAWKDTTPNCIYIYRPAPGPRRRHLQVHISPFSLRPRLPRRPVIQEDAAFMIGCASGRGVALAQGRIGSDDASPSPFYCVPAIAKYADACECCAGKPNLWSFNIWLHEVAAFAFWRWSLFMYGNGHILPHIKSYACGEVRGSSDSLPPVQAAPF